MDELEPNRPRRLRVVVADDDEIVRRSLSAALSRAHDVVGTACDAEEAVALVREKRPHVAILDVQMPGGGGLRATQEIKDAVPETAVIALSADEADSDVRQILLAGAVTYVRKGLSPTQLDEVIRTSAQPDHNQQDQAG